MENLTINISGMTCSHCVSGVTRALDALDGVEVRNVAVGSATVSYDPARTSPDKLEKAVEAAGYQVRPTQLGRAAPPATEVR